MAGGNGGMDSQLHEAYARAQGARSRSRVLAAQYRAAQRDIVDTSQLIQAAWDRAQQVRELWLAAHPAADLLRYSAYARLQARLASMPLIEQAKGIIMAQCGWPEDQAFDALRRPRSGRTSSCGTWPPRSRPNRRSRHLLNRTCAAARFEKP